MSDSALIRILCEGDRSRDDDMRHPSRVLDALQRESEPDGRWRSVTWYSRRRDHAREAALRDLRGNRLGMAASLHADADTAEAEGQVDEARHLRVLAREYETAAQRAVALHLR
jgi:hypothetical protein